MTDAATNFAHFIKGLGFRVFLAERKDYGFITDADGGRVLSFSFNDWSLSGNYGPPSRASGTGWRMDGTPGALRTAADVKKALNAMPPPFCQRADGDKRDGWRYLTTVDQYLQMYGSSSKFKEVMA